jgi:hypothetical protein
MTIPDYTLVCGVDKKHLEQLQLTFPTWRKHKPLLMQRPMLIFCDQHEVSPRVVKRAIGHPDLVVCPWPPTGVEYEGDFDDKWTHPQRVKMLTGFVYVAASLVQTPYWLKLDTDVVATGSPGWIDPAWFEDDPAVISHAWSFTKPPHQMEYLDGWVRRNWSELSGLGEFPPLNLSPEPGADRLKHKRIISWCSFWNTEFTKNCADWAQATCGPYKLPTPSQDGYLWYCAKRTQRGIIRTSMKKRGWAQWLTMK